jgi:hypothetical protein
MSANSLNDDLDDIFALPLPSQQPVLESPDFDPEEIFRPLPPTEIAAYSAYVQARPQEPTLPESGPVCYRIRLLRDTEWNAARVYSMLEKLLSGVEDLTFEIMADGLSIQWQIIDTRRRLNLTRIPSIIKSVFPQAAVEVSGYSEPVFSRPYRRIIMPFKQSNPYFAPIKYVEELTDHDPLIVLTNLLNQVEVGERVSYFVHVGRLDPHAYDRAWKQISKGTARAGNVVSAVAAGASKGGIYAGVIAGGIRSYIEIMKAFQDSSNPSRREPKFVNE